MKDQSNKVFAEYAAFRQGALGKHFEKWMQRRYQELIDKAGKSNDPQEAFGFLREAYGIMSVIKHIELSAKSAEQ